MKEIGGYMELEQFTLPMLHKDAVALNSGRSCLEYLIRARNIKKIALPYYLCDCVKKVCNKCGVSVQYYHIKDDFLPEEMDIAQDEWMYLVNYFGQIQPEKIEQLILQYGRVIVDNSQAYFDMPVKEADTLYTCRKFFGVADGAFLYTNVDWKEELSQDLSYNKMKHLLGRYERNASEFYSDYTANEDAFEFHSVKYMSRLTNNLLHGIDYQKLKEVRTRNFCYLSEQLTSRNLLKIQVPEGAFAYPLLVKQASRIRKKIIERKIYIPLLWPNVLENVSEATLEYYYSKNILPLPCDHRYGEEEMQKICDVILNLT